MSSSADEMLASLSEPEFIWRTATLSGATVSVVFMGESFPPAVNGSTAAYHSSLGSQVVYRTQTASSARMTIASAMITTQDRPADSTSAEVVRARSRSAEGISGSTSCVPFLSDMNYLVVMNELAL